MCIYIICFSCWFVGLAGFVIFIMLLYILNFLHYLSHYFVFIRLIFNNFVLTPNLLAGSHIRYITLLFCPKKQT